MSTGLLLLVLAIRRAAALVVSHTSTRGSFTPWVSNTAGSVDRASALPGDVLTYTITYVNLSNAPLTAIEVADATPAYTVFVDAACGTAGAGLMACGVSVQPVAGATGAVRWTLTGGLQPGASGSVTFRVRVQ